MKLRSLLVVLGLLAFLCASPIAMAQKPAAKHSAAWYKKHPAKHSAAWYKKHKKHSAAWYKKHKK